MKLRFQQECIPVGCVPAAVVDVRDGVTETPSPRQRPLDRDPPPPQSGPRPLPPARTDPLPPDRDPPPPPGQNRHPSSPDRDPPPPRPEQAPLRQDREPLPPLNRQTPCEDITLPILGMRPVNRTTQMTEYENRTTVVSFVRYWIKLRIFAPRELDVLLFTGTHYRYSHSSK